MAPCRGSQGRGAPPAGGPHGGRPGRGGGRGAAAQRLQLALVVGACAAFWLPGLGCGFQRSGPFTAPALRPWRRGIFGPDLKELPRGGLVARHGKGFGPSDKPKRKRVKVDVAQLRTDHGDKAAAVEKLLAGETAACPEDMVRARYSACRLRDALFMARTELDENRRSVEKRARGWAVTFGLEERVIDVDGPPGLNQALSKLNGLEIVAAEGNEVEFKLDCGDRILHERSIFQEDEKWGYIYSGDSVFEKWEDVEP